jgi:hypothetical protein
MPLPFYFTPPHTLAEYLIAKNNWYFCNSHIKCIHVKIVVFPFLIRNGRHFSTIKGVEILASLDAMVDDLTGDGDGAAGCGITGGEEERMSPEPGTAWLAATSPVEARKRNLGFGVLRVLGLRVHRLAEVSSPELGEV